MKALVGDIAINKEKAFSGHCENFAHLRFQHYPGLRPAVVFFALNDKVVVVGFVFQQMFSEVSRSFSYFHEKLPHVQCTHCKDWTLMS